MNCPACHGRQRVTDSRHQGDELINRQRRCRKCGLLEPTVELRKSFLSKLLRITEKAHGKDSPTCSA